jgi:hypothetical protein
MLLRKGTLVRLLLAAQLVIAAMFAAPVLSGDPLTYNDILSFYTGGSIVRDGQAGKLYDLDLQAVYQAKAFELESSDPRYGLLPFMNPPQVALIFTPLAYLSPKAAAAVYLALNCLIAAWVLRRLWLLAARWSRNEQMLLVTTTLAMDVLWYNLGTGTITLIAFVCLIEYYLAMKAGRDSRAAFWLVAATIKPQLILLPALIPLAQRRWRLVGMALAMALLIGLGISLSFGFHIWADYFRLLRQIGTHGEAYSAFPMLMDNLRMILYRTVTSAVVMPLVYLALLAGAISVFWMWRADREFDVRFALTVLLGLFLAPHSNYQDTLVVILSAALSYDFVRRKRGGLVPAFQVFMLTATFLPAALIFTGYFPTLQWIWPVPIIIGLTAVCALCLKSMNSKARGRNL